jgi:hypothetical protein
MFNVKIHSIRVDVTNHPISQPPSRTRLPPPVIRPRREGKYASTDRPYTTASLSVRRRHPASCFLDQ